VNGRAIESVDDAQRVFYGASVGDRLDLVVERAGRRLQLSFTLGEAPRSR
jgi:S1-C subfamily serine protease